MVISSATLKENCIFIIVLQLATCITHTYGILQRLEIIILCLTLAAAEQQLSLHI